MEKESKHPQYINSIIRATNILELYGRMYSTSLRISEISKELALQKTTVFNIVKTLVKQGWLIQDAPNGKYKLGSKVLLVSSAMIHNFSIEDRILLEMRSLRDLFNEDVVLTAMVDGLPVCVEKLQCSNVLRIQSKVGHLSNFLRGSTGKTLLAWQTEEFQDQYLESRGITGQERKDIKRELERIRDQGYCITISEQDEGVASVAVPIMGRHGVAEYSLAIIGVENRMREKGMDHMSEKLLEVARDLNLEHAYLYD